MDEAAEISRRLEILEGLVDLEIDVIHETRICKVLEEIVGLEVPGRDRFHLKNRSAKFLERLNQVLSGSSFSMSLYAEGMTEVGCGIMNKKEEIARVAGSEIE